MASRKCYHGVWWWKGVSLLFLLLSVTKCVREENFIQFLGEEPFRVFSSRGSTAGIVLYQLFAVNAMTGESAGIMYSLIRSNSSSRQFTVSQETGELVLNFVFTSLVGHNLTIEAQSANRAVRKQVNVIVFVVPELNGEPRYEHESYNLFILEDLPVGRNFSVVRAFSLATIPLLYAETYDIVGGTSEDEFAIELTSGFLSIQHALDKEARDNFILIIQFSFGSRSIYTQVRIDILDVNDNEPVLSKMIYNVSVHEDAEVSSYILTVLATDPDSGMNGKVLYYIDSSVKGQFTLNNTSGDLFLSVALDYEAIDVYQFSIIAQDEGSPSLNSTVIVIVNILNIDDECPKFQNSLFSAQYPAGVLGWDLVTVEATDPDKLSNVMYSIISTIGSNNQNFSIDSTSGAISLVTNGDTSGHYFLNVSASDATCAMQSFVPVEIRIGDTNNFSPEFKGNCKGTLMENSALGTKVVTLNAVDGDIGVYGIVTYSLFSTSLFSIDSSSGVVYTAQPPSSYDREAKPLHQIGVLARDAGLRQGYCLLTVMLEDENDNAPLFTSLGFNTTLSTTAKVGTILAQVRAIDYDFGANGNVTYSLEFPPDLWQAPFAVDSISGEVIVTGVLDKGRSEYVFTVVATDMGMPALSSNVVMNATLSQTPDSFPIFQESYYSTTLCETNLDFRTLLSVSATNSPFYRIIHGVTYQSNSDRVFFLQTNNLRLGSSHVINFEQLGPTKSFMFPIEARNINGSTLTTVEIFVRDIDDNHPVLDDNPSFTLAENQPEGTEVTKIVAVDLDSGTNGEIAYRLNDSSPYFNLSIDGTIRSTYIFDYENSSEVLRNIMRIEAYNPNPPETNQCRSFSIDSSIFPINWNILDQNDNPPSFSASLYSIETSEDQPTYTTILTFNASDPDASDKDRLHFSITSGNDGTFAVEANRLILATRLDFERKQSYSLNIEVTDEVHSGLTCIMCSAIVSIQVIDIDDTPPAFTDSFYSAELEENSAIGISILSVSAEDVDSESVRYWLSQQAQGIFSISDAGTISVSGSLDRESFSDGVVSFLVFADGGFTMSARVNVTLLDINDHAPRFEALYSGIVQENVMPGVEGIFVVQVTATDSDQGQNGTVMYILSGMKHGFMIDLNSGIITAHAMYDREIQSSYLLTVLAVDDGYPSRLTSSMLVTVEIGDVNDNAPFFPFPYMFARIFEEPNFGTHILDIPATDLDNGVNASITYTLISSNIAGKFTIHSTTGAVSVTGSLDYEIPLHRDNYLIISIHDPEFLGKVLGNLSISLMDLNDNVPHVMQIIYNPTIGVIPENALPGPILATVIATDGDQGSNGELVFSLVNGNEGGGFEINSAGEVRNTLLLDYETNYLYNLLVSVSDRGNPSLSADAELAFVVGDVNDNYPTFATEVYQVCVMEGVTAMPSIFSVAATDPDSGNRGMIGSYDILSGNIGNKFILNSITGVFGTNGIFDREDIDSYTLIISASDMGSDPQTGTGVIQVDITDINDSPSLSGGLLQVFMYGRDGVLHNTTVTPVYFDDPDFLYTFQDCEIVQSSALLFEVDSKCMLKLTQSNPEADTYRYNVTGNDGMHANVYSSINIRVDYINSRDFPDGSTVTITVNASVHQFFSLGLNVSLPALIAQHLGIKQQNLLIVSIQHGYHDPTNSLDITFSARAASGELMSSLVIINKLFLVKENLFVGRHGVVSIPTDPCVTEPCFNQARCRTTRIIGISQHAVSSSKYVLFAPATRLGYECDCILGTAGDLCEIDYDDCYSSPCSYDVPCTNTPQGFICDCPEGTSGADCSFNPNECSSDPCQNGATCVNGFDLHICNCQPGFYGRECQYSYFHDSFTCDTNPCQNGGICSPGRDTFTCFCANGFDGSLCESHVLIHGGCVGNPCHNGSSCTDTDQGPHCHCSVGFTGPFCRWPLNNCELNPCKNGATCEQGFYGSYLCTCPAGYTGKNCTDHISVCSSNPCLNNGHCIDNVVDDSFVCQCHGPFYGVLCELSLFPIDLCMDFSFQSQRPLCFNCTSGNEGYTCSCPIGIHGHDCSLLLLPGEATPCSSNPCQYGGTCILDSVGSSYTCHCPIGFNGSDCEIKINECLSNSCLNEGICMDGVGGFICNCSPGITGNICQIHCPPGRKGEFCDEEIQYCELSSCLNGGTCIEKTGGFECQCPIYHTGSQCMFENDCSTTRCSNAGTCTDLATGSSECSCPHGFEGKNCELLTASFSGGSTSNSFRTFLPLEPQGQRRITLEFATRAADGLLLYSTQYQQGKSKDFIAAEVVGGYVRVCVSHGSGKGDVVLANSSVQVNDGNWHQMTIEVQGKSFSVLLDQCHLLDEEILTLAGCQSSTTTPGANSFLNLGLPLWIGGVPFPAPFSPDHISSVGFAGCIRNITIDNQLLDLEAFIEQRNSERGCGQAYDRCGFLNGGGGSLCGGGICVPQVGGYSCICPPLRAGDNCERNASGLMFSGGSYVQYSLNDLSTTSSSVTTMAGFNRRKREVFTSRSTISDQFSFRFRTELDQGVLFHIGLAGSSGEDFSYAEIIAGGCLNYHINLGSREETIALPCEFSTVDDAEWHFFQADRIALYLKLTLDNFTLFHTLGGDQLYLNINRSHIYAGGKPQSNLPEKHYIGCLKDIRIDQNVLPTSGGNKFATVVFNGSEGSVGLGCALKGCYPNPCRMGNCTEDGERDFICSCNDGSSVTSAPCSEPEPATLFKLVIIIGILVGGTFLILISLIFVMFCKKLQLNSKYSTMRLTAGHLHSIPCKLTMASRDSIGVSNIEGGGEQDTSMTYEKWKQSCSPPRKDKTQEDNTPLSEITLSSESSIDKPLIFDETDVPVVKYDHLPQLGIGNQPPQGSMQGPLINDYIFHRLEMLKSQHCHKNAIRKLEDRVSNAPSLSLQSQCSHCLNDELYTVQHLKKAGPELASCGKVLDVLAEEENEMMDLESELVSTGHTKTQAETRALQSQSHRSHRQFFV